MLKYTLTIGLNDKDQEEQIIPTFDAKQIIADTLINKYNVFAFTMFRCAGVYKMNSTGRIIQEESLRIEIATDEELQEIRNIVSDLKTELNQETIMLEISNTDISFL